MELMTCVQGYISTGNVPPILPPSGGSIDEVILLSQTMGVAVGNIMQQKITNFIVPQTEHCIKLFLSMYHRVDKALLNEGDKPGWLTTYNFLCLLNIP
jgi:hypothetical protein